MRTDQFDFELPDHAIALEPANPRDSARLLTVPADPASAFSSHTIADLPTLLRPDDVLVLNDTRVIPAALTGRRLRDGGPGAAMSATLVRRISDNSWTALARPTKRMAQGDRIAFAAPSNNTTAHDTPVFATVSAKYATGEIELTFDDRGPALDDAIARIGAMPLPPYIASKRAAAKTDEQNYQTVFAKRPGAIAAPTAGLHITQHLLEALTARGITHHFVTLHVGMGTFLPVKVDAIKDHVMHTEWGEVTPETAAALTRARAEGRRIVSVGTTALRILESAATEDAIKPFSGDTQIFISPGYQFRAVDVLLTNFHLPRSTLFMLVSAFSGLDRMKAAYAHALANNYRFFSYGDATLLTRAPSAPSVPGRIASSR